MEKKESTCVTCGKNFLSFHANYCSHSCYQKKNHRYLGIREFTCVQCGKTFRSQQKARYCSQNCRALHWYRKVHGEPKPKAVKIKKVVKVKKKIPAPPPQPKPKICLYCHDPFINRGNYKYCCHEHRVLAGKTFEPKKRYCEVCGKRISGYQYRFCSEHTPQPKPQTPIEKPRHDLCIWCKKPLGKDTVECESPSGNVTVYHKGCWLKALE